MQATYTQPTFQAIVEAMPSAVVLMNAEGHITYINHQTEKLFGYERQDLIGQEIEILIPQRFKHHHPKLRDGFIAAPSVRHMGPGRDLYALRKDGTEFPVEIGLNPVNTGDKVLIIASIIDITERKTANEKLIQAHRLYLFLSRINQTIVHLKDKQTLFDEACQIAAEVGKFQIAWIGLVNTENKTINLVAQRGFLEQDTHLFKNFAYKASVVLNQVITKGECYICNNIERDFQGQAWKATLLGLGCRSFIVLPLKRGGHTVGIFSLASGTDDFFDADELALLTEAAEDISFAKGVFEKDKQRQAAERALQQSASNINQIIDIIPQAVFAQNAAGKFIFVNKGFSQLYHVGPEFLLNKTFEEVLTGYNTLAHSREEEIATIQSGKMKVIPEMRVTDYLGKERFFYVTKLPYTVPETNEKALLTIAMDITERKEAERERERIITDLVKRNKDLEQFAHILSHNVRAPLSTILGLTSLAKAGVTPEEQEVIIDSIANRADQLDKIVVDLNEILEVKRDLYELKMPVKLQEVLEEVTHMLTTLINNKMAQIETDFSSLPEVVSVRAFVNSIFFNLISNALKFANPEVKPIIRVSSAQADGRLYLRFEDNGLGIDLDKYGTQVFTIYKRFHNGIEGSGIGLFMVKNQVESLKGQIELDSKPGLGSVFKITLPLN